MAAVGHEAGAAVVVGSANDGVEATGDGPPAVEPPQAAAAAVKKSMISPERHERLSDNRNASFASRRLDAN